MQKFLSVCFLLFSTLLVIGCGNKINKSHLFAEPGISMNAYLEPEIQTKMDEVLQGSSGAIYLLGLLRLSGDSKYLDGYGTSVAGSLPIPLPLPKIPIGVDIGAVKSAAAYNAIKGSEADILVNPKYTISVTKALLFTTVSVGVTGYAGYITNIQQIGIRDIQH